MKSIAWFTCVALLFATSGCSKSNHPTAPAGSNDWTRTTGPEGGTIFSLVVHGGVVHAGLESGGVWRQPIPGGPWESLGLDGETVHALASKGATLIAGTDAGTKFSFNGGRTWSGEGPGTTPASVKIVGVCSDTVFAGTWDGVFRSGDDGQSWLESDEGIPAGSDVRSIAVDGRTVFVGAVGGIYRSSDGGHKWTVVTSGLFNPYQIGWSLLVRNQVVYAGCYGVVYRSIDQGDTWSEALSGGDTWTALAGDGSAVYAASYFSGTGTPPASCVFKSIDDGQTWTPIDPGSVGKSIWSLAASAGRIWVGADDEGMFFSSNGGAAWTPSNTRLVGTKVPDMATDGVSLFAATATGVFRSQNSGATWDLVSTDVPYASKLVYAAHELFAITGTGLYRSSGAGATWTRTNGLPGGDLVAIGDTLFKTDGYGGLQRSENAGDTWADVTAPNQVFAIAVHGQSLFIAGGAVARTDNGGVTWTPLGNPVPVGSLNPRVTDLAVSGDVILVALPYDGLFLRATGSSSWASASSPLPHYSLRLLANSNAIYAIGAGGVARSTDGVQWTSVGTLPGYVRSLAFAGVSLFAGTQGSGVWRYR